MTTVIFRTTARILTPVIFLTAVTLFLQGHNLPGGGFVAGVLTALGVALYVMAFDRETFVDVLFGPDRAIDPERDDVATSAVSSSGLGLAVALLAGLAAVALGAAFLAQDYAVLHPPVVGELEVASAVVFDLGVAVTVVGALVAVVFAVGGGGD